MPFFDSMQVFHTLEDVPAHLGPTLVSVGNFDGVHRAHAHAWGNRVEGPRDRGNGCGSDLRTASYAHPPAGSGLKPHPHAEKLRWLESTELRRVAVSFGHLSLMTRVSLPSAS
jgi:riboflavin kinase/FMN adenylyltransferase